MFSWARGLFATDPLYRIREDGSGLQKAIPDALTYFYDVSPGGKAVAVLRGGTIEVYRTEGGPPIAVSTVCAAAGGENRGTTPPCASWSPDGKFLYLNDRRADQIYAVPIPAGRILPELPPEGIGSAEQAAALPGAWVIRERYAFLGAGPSTYPFFRVAVQRNIYGIAVP